MTLLGSRSKFLQDDHVGVIMTWNSRSNLCLCLHGMVWLSVGDDVVAVVVQMAHC